MEEPPEGRWSCPTCESTGAAKEEEEEKKITANMEYCRICKVAFLNDFSRIHELAVAHFIENRDLLEGVSSATNLSALSE